MPTPVTFACTDVRLKSNPNLELTRHNAVAPPVPEPEWDEFDLVGLFTEEETILIEDDSAPEAMELATEDTVASTIGSAEPSVDRCARPPQARQPLRTRETRTIRRRRQPPPEALAKPQPKTSRRDQPSRPFQPKARAHHRRRQPSPEAPARSEPKKSRRDESSHPKRRVQLYEGQPQVTAWPAAQRQPSVVCPVPGCTSTDRRLRRHLLSSHLPSIFSERTSSEGLCRKRLSAVTALVTAAMGKSATLMDAVSRLNSESIIPADSFVHEDLIPGMTGMCRLMRWDVPPEFTLRPINSPAVLSHWRCITALLSRVSHDQRQAWCASGRMSPDTEATPVAELPGYCGPRTVQAFDSHFHLDRSRRDLRLPRRATVEDLISTPQDHKPQLSVDVVGGVVIYSEPSTYPTQLPPRGRWRTAVGVHPKHVEELKDNVIRKLRQWLPRPEISALGEIGLDRTVPPREWSKQDRALEELLKLAIPEKAIVLHIRGQDPCAVDAHSTAFLLVQSACLPHQMIHLHCFTGNRQILDRWTRAFRNTYVGFTAAVRLFDRTQTEAVRAVSADRLLLETDAPYLPPSGRTTEVNTPAFIGDVATLVANCRGVPTEEVLAQSLRNGRALYP